MGQPGIAIVASSKQSKDSVARLPTVPVWEQSWKVSVKMPGSNKRGRSRSRTAESSSASSQTTPWRACAKRVSEESKLWQSDPDLRHFTCHGLAGCGPVAPKRKELKLATLFKCPRESMSEARTARHASRSVLGVDPVRLTVVPSERCVLQITTLTTMNGKAGHLALYLYCTHCVPN